MVSMFTASFITDLTAEGNVRLSAIARRPLPSTKQREDEIAREDRQRKRLTDRLGRADVTHPDAVRAKAEAMGRKLPDKREHLKELQRAARRPSVMRVREQDVMVSLGRMRERLQGDVGAAAGVLHSPIGDVVVESRYVEGRRRPEMVARYTIDGIVARAALDRGKGVGTVDPTQGLWEFLHGDRWIMPGHAPCGRHDVTVPLGKPPTYEVMLPQTVEMVEAASSIDPIPRTLGIGAAVVRDGPYLHQTGTRPPRRGGGRRQPSRRPEMRIPMEASPGARQTHRYTIPS